MSYSIRSLLRFVALIWLALGMSVPVSAWTVHKVSHDAAQVSVDAHHHHDDDGGISVHELGDDDAPDGGHDHMPSILLGAAAVPDVNLSLIEPIIVRQTFMISPSRGVERQASNGLRRPPRLG